MIENNDQTIIDRLYQEINQLKALVIAQQYCFQHPQLKFKIEIKPYHHPTGTAYNLYINVALLQNGIIFTECASINRVLPGKPMSTIINLSITFSPAIISYSFTFDDTTDAVKTGDIKEYLIYFSKYNDNDKYYKLEIITSHTYNVHPSSRTHQGYKYNKDDINNFDTVIHKFCTKNMINITKIS
jgi:hypothetical protein